MIIVIITTQYVWPPLRRDVQYWIQYILKRGKVGSVQRLASYSARQVKKSRGLSTSSFCVNLLSHSNMSTCHSHILQPISAILRRRAELLWILHVKWSFIQAPPKRSSTQSVMDVIFTYPAICQHKLYYLNAFYDQLCIFLCVTVCAHRLEKKV